MNSHPILVQREALILELRRYIDNELLCYRAETSTKLHLKQAILWQPLLDWVATRFGPTWRITSGLMPIAQSETVHINMTYALMQLDTLSLAFITNVTRLIGSLVLAFSLLEKRISADEAFTLGYLEELYQIEKWGSDEDARNRLDIIKAQLLSYFDGFFTPVQAVR